jgi:pimeloyl-ACP methyl ester carboxylesterase
MQSVRSADGTPIAFWRSGSGPPLLLIHGVIASHATTWRLILPQLAQQFTVYAMDRRGRGASGDSSAYTLDREADDILAVVDAIGQAVDVVGHSFGGLCALEGALRTDSMRRLILYEAVPLRGADNYPPDVIPKLDALLAANQIEPALLTMLREIVGLGDADIDMLRRDPDAWATRLSNTRAMPRELRAEHEYVFLPERFTDLRVPTLLLVGEASAARELSNARGVAAALPSARIHLLPEQQHLAMFTAPDMFVRAVLEFLAEH